MSRARHSTTKRHGRNRVAGKPVRAPGRHEPTREQDVGPGPSPRPPVGVAPADPVPPPADMPPPVHLTDRILTEADRHTRCSASSAKSVWCGAKAEPGSRRGHAGS